MTIVLLYKPKQSCAHLQLVLAKDGVTGLLFRGLGTKILSNGMQGLMFNVLWRMGMDAWNKREADAAAAAKK
jgi:hypothetical protein